MLRLAWRSMSWSEVQGWCRFGCLLTVFKHCDRLLQNAIQPRRLYETSFIAQIAIFLVAAMMVAQCKQMLERDCSQLQGLLVSSSGEYFQVNFCKAIYSAKYDDWHRLSPQHLTEGGGVGGGCRPGWQQQLSSKFKRKTKHLRKLQIQSGAHQEMQMHNATKWKDPKRRLYWPSSPLHLESDRESRYLTRVSLKVSSSNSLRKRKFLLVRHVLLAMTWHATLRSNICNGGVLSPGVPPFATPAARLCNLSIGLSTLWERDAP